MTTKADRSDLARAMAKAIAYRDGNCTCGYGNARGKLTIYWECV